MEVNSMINPILTSQFEDEILDLIDNSSEYTRSDLQGIVTVLVNKIMQKGHEILSEEEQS
jgi:hypothetical protein